MSYRNMTYQEHTHSACVCGTHIKCVTEHREHLLEHSLETEGGGAGGRRRWAPVLFKCPALLWCGTTQASPTSSESPECLVACVPGEPPTQGAFPGERLRDTPRYSFHAQSF